MENDVIHYISELDTGKDTWKLKVRILKVWKTTYSLDMIVMDERSDKIQASVKMVVCPQFEGLISEGIVVFVSKFGIGDNNGKYPALKHRYKLNFYRGTLLKKCQILDFPLHGFDFFPFAEISNQGDDPDLPVDVIGCVVESGNLEVYPKDNGKQGKRLTLLLEDLKGLKVTCTLWDGYAVQFHEYAVSNRIQAHVVIILQFARIRDWKDDVMFLGDWSVSNAMNLRRILRCFYIASGLKINLSKCSVYGISVNNEELTQMSGALRCQPGKFPFKYLGLQVGANMNLIKNWSPVVDTFRKRLSIWKAKQLSFGGRIILLNSVLNSLPTYYFSLYRAPVQVIATLDRIRRTFFWGGSLEKVKINWIAWDKIILPKHLGGIGLGSLKDTNVSLLTKWWWRFKVESNAIWRKVIWSIHASSRAWNFIPVNLSQPGPWKQIHKALDVYQNLGLDIVDYFKLEASGKWSWKLDTSGVFSVKSIKEEIRNSMNLNPSIISCWNNWVPQKVSVVAWRAAQERLPTLVGLAKRNIVTSNLLCPCCGNFEESSEHLFISCGLAQRVWQIISLWCKIPPIFAFDISDLLGIHKSLNLNKFEAKAINAIILVSIWCIWKKRNEKVFKNKDIVLGAVIEEIKILASLWIGSRVKSDKIKIFNWSFCI